MTKLTIKERDDWISKNDDIIELLEKNGFHADINERYTDLLFFQKELEFPINLGTDITNERLELPHLSPSFKEMEKFYKKYRVNISFPNYFEKSIKREHKIFITYCIRLNINENKNYSDPDSITVMVLHNDLKAKFLSNKFLNDKDDCLYYTHYNLKELTLENVKTTINNAKEKMKKATKLIEENIPKVIEIMREEIENHYKEYQQAIISMKLRQFLNGSIIQFDALNS